MRTEFFSSPSQVSTYELCARKWAWRYVDGIEGPPNKFAEFGIKTHAYLEKWLALRVPPSGSPEARVAQVMLAHLPPPHLVDPKNVEIESGITVEGINFIMKLDLWMPDLELPTVYDHKTTKSFDWALTPKAMSDDVQATMYAGWAFVKTGAPRIGVQWTYGKTQGSPEAHPVRRILERAEVAERLARSIRSSHEMRVIQESKCSAIEVPYDASGCEAFGGCPYRDLCNLTARDKLEAFMSQGTAKEDFLQKMRERKGKNGASPGQVNPPESKVAESALVNKLAAKLASRKAAEEPPELQPDPIVEEEAPKARGRGRPAGSKNAAPEPTPASDQWVVFASHAVQPLIGALQLEEVADGEMQEGVAQTAGLFADAMLKEYLSRFGG
jgi:hypothetical protein